MKRRFYKSAVKALELFRIYQHKKTLNGIVRNIRNLGDINKNNCLSMGYEGDRRVPDPLNNVIQIRFCEGYHFRKIAEKNENYLKLFGFPVSYVEPEKELDHEEEEETDI